jgi:hypothetical protein
MNTPLDRALTSTLTCFPMVLISLVGDYASDTHEKATRIWGSIRLICNPKFYNIPIYIPNVEYIMGIPASWLIEYIKNSTIVTCQLCNHICSFEQYMLIKGERLNIWLCIGCNTSNSC